MTKQEGAILSAYTGILLTDFSVFHKYVEEILDRPVFTHELGSSVITERIKEASKQDFLALMENLSD